VVYHIYRGSRRQGSCHTKAVILTALKSASRKLVSGKLI
jgi:hypothetical protein